MNLDVSDPRVLYIPTIPVSILDLWHFSPDHDLVAVHLAQVILKGLFKPEFYEEEKVLSIVTASTIWRTLHKG